MITFDEVTYIYNKGTPMERTAVKGMSLSICAGEFVAVLGGAGSGKSTFLQLLGGLLDPTSGGITVSLASEKTGEGSTVGVVPQFPEKQFFEETVYKDLSFPLRLNNITEEEAEERVRYALRRVDMDIKSYRDRPPLDLSSGEKRRVAIAAVLVLDPAIIVLDEPFAGLDNKGRKDIFYELKRLCKETGKGVVIATQDAEMVSEGFDRVVMLEHGRLVGDGGADIHKDLYSPIPSLCNRLKSKGLDIGDGINNAEELFLRIKDAAEKRKKLLT